jgi:dTDP-3-amino-3,4,6-trideoxy-alpha-D-glucose transaminase
MSGASARPGVPFVDLARQHRPIAAELSAAFERVIDRGDFVLGDDVALFEDEFARYVTAEQCVGVGSGTAALTIMLQAMGIGPGDEVIVPANTFVASALAVVHAGAEPVFCDVEDPTGLIDLASAEDAVGPRTAAVMLVHLYGQPCDMDGATRFAARHGLAAVEDAAQAHGASWRGRRAGSLALAAAFSFYPSKNLGALGDGGAICTSDAGIAERARRLRNLGQRTKGEHVAVGYNERLDTLQAAVLRVKLRHLDEWNRQRRIAADRYRALLPGSRLPAVRTAAEDALHLFPVRVADRDAVAAALREVGIHTGTHYHPAAHRQAPLRAARRTDAAVAERWAAEELSLPMFAGLSEEEVERVCDALEATLSGPPTPRSRAHRAAGPI